MTDNIIHVDFQKPDSRWLKKAFTARDAGQVEKAVQLFRSAVEQNPDDLETGLQYALYLREIACWRSSLRECYRLLCLFPDEHKLYGLIYRNLLVLGLENDACFAYEHYMAHLYQNPEDGLNLNEEDPPMPEKPPKRRFNHLLLRAARLMERGDYDRANVLLAHANHPTFPKKSILRDLLEVQLMAKTGLEEQAREAIYKLMDSGELNACHSLALLPVVKQLEGPEFAGKLFMYAASVALEPNELRDITAACIGLQQYELVVSILENLVENNEYRIDLLYQLAVAYLYNGEMKLAWQLVQRCHLLDPCDAAVDYLYRLMADCVSSGATADDILKMPISLYGSANNVGRMVQKLHTHEVLTQNSPEETAQLLLNYPEQTRIMDTLCMADNEEMDLLLNAILLLPPEKREGLLRQCLLFGELDEDAAVMFLEQLAAIDVSGEVLLTRHGKLTAESAEDFQQFLD